MSLPDVPKLADRSLYNFLQEVKKSLATPAVAAAATASAVAWANITGKPATFTPSTHSHPQSEVTNLVTDLAGKADVVHAHAQSDVTGLAAALAGKSDTSHTHTGFVPQTSFRTAEFYGTLNGNNIADNKATLDAAVASSDSSMWLPGLGSETLYTTNTLSQLAGHKWKGDTKFRTASGAYMPGNFRYLSSDPTAGTGTDIQKDFTGDLWFCDASYDIVGGFFSTVRQNFVSTYFDPKYTPRWHRFAPHGGHSGTSAVVNGAAAMGATAIPIDLSGTAGGVSGFSAGQTITILEAAGERWTPGDEIPGTENNVVWTVLTAATPITGSGASATLHLDPTTPLPEAVSSGMVVSHGLRTHSTAHYIHVDGYAAGDVGALSIRTTAARPALAGQRHPFLHQTVGNIHGEANLGAHGTYCNWAEALVQDNGFQGWGIGLILNLSRQNNSNPTVNKWYGINLKSGGSGYVAIDAFLAFSGKGNRGLDTVQVDLGADKAAIHLASDQRIYFNGTFTVDNPDVYPLHGNYLGNSYLVHGYDVPSSDPGVRSGPYMDWFVGGVRGIRARPTAVNCALPMNLASTLAAVGDIESAAFVKGQFLQSTAVAGAGAHLIYFGDQSLGASYIRLDTALNQASIVVNGATKASW